MQDTLNIGAIINGINSIDAAAVVLAQCIHNSDVGSGIAIKEDWDIDASYRKSLIHEAKIKILDYKKEDSDGTH